MMGEFPGFTLTRVYTLTDGVLPLLARWLISVISRFADRLEGAEQITQLMGATPISASTLHATTPGAVCPYC